MSQEQKNMINYSHLTQEQSRTIRVSNQGAINAYFNKMRGTQMCVTLDKYSLAPALMPCSETATSTTFQQYSMTKEDFCKLHNEVPDLKHVSQYNSMCSCPFGTRLYQGKCIINQSTYAGPQQQYALPDGTPVDMNK